MPTNRSLASLAKQLERAIPVGFPPFDAAAFLNGTYKLPPELQHSPLPGLGEGRGVRDRASRLGEGSGVRDEPVTTPGPLPAPEVVNTSEPETTTSNHLRNPRKRCRAIAKSGQPCNAYRLRAGDLCLFHEADAVTNVQEARTRGGRQSPAHQRDALDLDLLPVDFHDTSSLLAFTEGLIRMQLAGAIPHRQCSQILRTLRIAERTLSAASPDTAAHLAAVRAFVDASSTVAEHLETRETTEQAREIENVGAKRQEYLKANQQFGHNQPKPAPNHSPSHPSFPPAGWRPNFLPTSPFYNNPLFRP
ncbi:MAG: hypothetical protein IPO51_05605 [Dehalococcoidia bacterium]|nr:hypothetical protein [Dehalococcoidia bacterium]